MTFEEYKTMRDSFLRKIEDMNEDPEIMKAKIEQLDADWLSEKTKIANEMALNSGIPETPFEDILENNKTNENRKEEFKMINNFYSTDEYRKSFMDFVLEGKPLMKNGDETTSASEAGGVIPTPIFEKVIQKLEAVGSVLAEVTKTNFKGGLVVPYVSLKPTASWVGESSTAYNQEHAIAGLTFAYHKLTCRVAFSLATEVVTLDIFETTVANNIAEAMIKAIETAIIKGSGSGQPKGILTETASTDVELTEGNDITYEDLCAMEAGIGEGYTDACYCFNERTWDSQIVGMVDDNGQPIARINAGLSGKMERRLFGRKVILSSDVPAFASSVTGDTTVGFAYNFGDYILNTNLGITLKQYVDEATDDRIMKALALIDGKCANTDSLVTLTIKNS